MGFHPDRFTVLAILRKVGWLAEWQDLGLGREDLAPRQIISTPSRDFVPIARPPNSEPIPVDPGRGRVSGRGGTGRESREIVGYHPVRANSPNSIQHHEVGIKFAGSRIDDEVGIDPLVRLEETEAGETRAAGHGGATRFQ